MNIIKHMALLLAVISCVVLACQGLGNSDTKDCLVNRMRRQAQAPQLHRRFARWRQGWNNRFENVDDGAIFDTIGSGNSFSNIGEGAVIG